MASCAGPSIDFHSLPDGRQDRVSGRRPELRPGHAPRETPGGVVIAGIDGGDDIELGDDIDLMVTLSVVIILTVVMTSMVLMTSTAKPLFMAE